MSLNWLLFAAVQRGAANDVQSILDTGQADVNTLDESGWTPLMRAAARDDTQVVEVLLANDADPRPADKGGLTALRLAGPATKPLLLAALGMGDEGPVRRT